MVLRRLTIGMLAVLLLPALVLTFARAAAPHGGVWVRLVAFTPYAAPLYLLVVVLMLLAWWRAQGRLRSAAKALVLLGTVGLVTHLLWAGGAYVGPAAAAQSGRTVRVLTSNLMIGGADAAQVVGAAVARRADLLVLEEVTPAARQRLRAAGVDAAFPWHAGRPSDGPSGTMVFAKGRLTDVRRIPTAYGGYVMRARTGAGVLRLLAVHPRPPLGDAAAWAADLNAVRTAAVAQDGPTIIAGDFNATTDHLPLRDLRGRGFDDAAVQARSGWQPTWPSADEVSLLGVPIPSLVALDHVLVADGLHAAATATVTVAGSDHRALFAILSR